MKMTDDDLLAFLRREQDDARQYMSGEVANERHDALTAYLREPYGTEEEGRSQVVASDVFDTVESLLPELVEVFVAGDEVVRFDPVGPEDVEGAEQATSAVNYVLNKQNNGFLLLYTAAKDALMLRTGAVKWYWEDKRTATFQTLRIADEMQLAVWLATNPGAEVIGQNETEADGAPAIEIRIKKIERKKQCRVVNVHPDNFFVSPRHNSILLDDCPYVAHIERRTLSDIRDMGFDVDEEDLKASVAPHEEDQLLQYRSGDFLRRMDNESDRSQTSGWLAEEYVLVDYDGDGIAERRRILRLGDKILENEETSHVQMAGWAPYLLTHKFDGLSVADLVGEFQRMRTELWRLQMDAAFASVNQETVVQTDSQGAPLANIDDLLNRRPGGILREKVAGAIRPYVEQFRGMEIQPLLEAMEVAKENRTGFTRYSQGLDANSLNKTATGVSLIMNASQRRMKLMARIMAEALVAPMMRGIFKTLTDYCIERLSFRLNGKFVAYDPQEWRDGYDMSINVGLGAGDKLTQMQSLGGIEAAQMAAVQGGGMGLLLTPKNLYNLQKRKVELAGYKDAAEFWTDPGDQMPQAQPQQDPKAQAAAARAQIDAAKLQQADQQFAAAQHADAGKFHAQQQFDARLKELELQFEAAEAERQRQHEMQMEAMRLQAQHASKRLETGKTSVTRNDDGEEIEVDPTHATLDAVAQSLAMLSQALMAPKRVIRDETGRAVGVEPVPQG